MVVFYLDTSVIVKRYMEEPGTEFADMLYEEICGSKEHSLSTSILTLVEFVATVRRARKGRIITEEDLHDIIYLFTKEIEHINLRPLDENIMVKSIRIIMDHSLRTADALHLSSAVELRDMMKDLNEDVVLVSNDMEMCNAALNIGFKVLKPDGKGIMKLQKIMDND